MRLQARITFRLDDENQAREILEPFRLKPTKGTFIHLVVLPLESEQYESLLKELSVRNLPYTVKRELAFDKEDFDDAEFFEMAPKVQSGYPQPEDGYEAEVYDRSTACPVCGKGARQVSPFSLRNRPAFGNNDIVAMFWTYEFLVTEKLKRLISDANLTGVEFWPLLRYRKERVRMVIEDAFQLNVVAELPPVSPRTRIEFVRLPKGASPCSCGRLGRNLPMDSQIVYRRKDLKDACDFNRTCEWFGGGFDTSQFKIVRRKVYEVFIRQKVRGVDFRPVAIEE